ncbi:MAG: polyprenyl synthetase family protein, partial [Candidatus Nitrosomaritimum aestuariumsis]
PILMAIKSSKGNNKKKILKAFGNQKASKKDLKEAVEVIRELGIEENVRKQALKYAEKAEKSLAKYSGSPKKELVELLDFVVKRSL